MNKKQSSTISLPELVSMRSDPFDLSYELRTARCLMPIPKGLYDRIKEMADKNFIQPWEVIEVLVNSRFSA
jgi:hypothetical protein